MATKVSSRARWMRLRKSLVRYNATENMLTSFSNLLTSVATAKPEDVTYKWTNTFKTHLAMTINGAKSGIVIDRNHMKLLLETPKFKDIFRALIDDTKRGNPMRFDYLVNATQEESVLVQSILSVETMTDKDLKRVVDTVLQTEVNKWLDEFVVAGILTKIDAGLKERRNTKTGPTIVCRAGRQTQENL